MNWVLLTASFGEERFHKSAQRLVRQAQESELFKNIVHITEQELERYAPVVTSKYSSLLNSKHPGFGYFSWKSEIVDTALKHFPDSGILYVDAGCELNYRQIAKLHLYWILSWAKSGDFFHTLDYPEKRYTKRLVLDYFSLSDDEANSPQFQATWFALAGERGRLIAETWKNGVIAGQAMIDDTSSQEDKSYVGHRYDQSVLSCSLKSLGIKARRHRPCYRPVSLLSSVNCYFHPIWSARNRSGESINEMKGTK